MVSGWLTYAVDNLRDKLKTARQGCQPAESGGAQAGTERGRVWRSGGAQAETERGEYILSVRLNQAAGFIIYRLKFIFRPGQRRRAAVVSRSSGEATVRLICGRRRLYRTGAHIQEHSVSGYVLYRDMCRTGMLAALGRVSHRGACGAGRRGVALFRGRNAVLCRDGWKRVLFIF